VDEKKLNTEIQRNRSAGRVVPSYSGKLHYSAPVHDSTLGERSLRCIPTSGCAGSRAKITLLARLLYQVIILFPNPFLPPRDGCLLSRPLRPNYPVSDPPARFISNDRENNEDTTDGLSFRVVL
jgi:hypothetical protein